MSLLLWGSQGWLLDFVNSSPTPGFTRASSGTYLDSTGVLVTAAANAARFGYSTAGAKLGLLMEPTRDNLLLNSTMVGAVAGTPGTPPTGWTIQTVGLTLTIVGTGTEDGYNYIDARWSGTTVFGGMYLFLPQTLGVAASTGQTYTASGLLRLVAGSLTNATLTLSVQELNAGLGVLASSTQLVVPTSAALKTQQHSLTRTLNQATTAKVRSQILGSVNGAVDFTLRYGWPQIELGTGASSRIATSTAAVQRAVDLMGFGASMNPGQGTVLVTYWPQVSALGAVQNLFQLDDGTDDNAHAVQLTATGEAQVVCTAGGGATGTLTGTGVTAGAQRKICYSYGPAGFRMSQDGAALVTAAAGALPRLAQARLGNNVAGTTPMLGYQRSIQYWPVQRNDERALAA